MRRVAMTLLVTALLALGACVSTRGRMGVQDRAARAVPPERTNGDESDGPTAPNGATYRPPNQGAGYGSP